MKLHNFILDLLLLAASCAAISQGQHWLALFFALLMVRPGGRYT